MVLAVMWTDLGLNPGLVRKGIREIDGAAGSIRKMRGWFLKIKISESVMLNEA